MKVRPAMNVYDFDGTIYNGDSTIDFFLYALKRNPSVLRYLPKQVWGFVLYGIKRIDKTKLKEYFFSFLSAINAEELTNAFWNQNQKKIFDWYLNQQKPDDIIISASPEFLLQPICSRLGIRHLIASEVDPKTGMFTSENCRGQAKARRLKAEYNVTYIDRFYSDSHSDLPLAKIASKAFLVKKGIAREWKDLQAMNRDKTIDRLRGFAMFWVIVVHVLYWGNFFTSEYVNLIKSFCLFEMPLFFFITGASNSFSKINSYCDFIKNRFRRILIPYWAFAIICAVLSIVKYSLENSMDILTGIKVLLSWLVPIGRQMTSVAYLTWALWFIPVYLCVALIIPFLNQAKCSARKTEFAFLLFGIFTVTFLLKIGWAQNVAFYSFWTYVGLFYRDIKLAVEHKRTRKIFLYTAAAGAAAICILYFAGQSLDMQSNKFPPNIIFFIFSAMMLSLIMLAIPYFDRLFGWLEKDNLAGKIFNLFSTRSMTIFLYQVFAFHLTIRFANMLIYGDGIIASFTKSVLCLVATVPVCAGLAAVFGRIEKL